MIELINKYLYEAEQNFDLTMMKVDAVSEAAIRQYNINCASAELKVMQESGTDDDLAYYCEEAEKGFVASLVAILEKIKDAIVKFFSELKDKMLSLFTRKETNDAIEKIEKKVKIFPLFGRKKVMVPDVNAQKKEAEKAMSKLARIKARLFSGHKVSVDEVDEVEKSFMEAHGKQIGVAAAATVTIGAALVYLKSIMKKAPEDCKGLNKAAKNMLDDCKKLAGISDAENASVIRALAGAVASISKTTASGLVGSVKRTMTSIKEAGQNFAANNKIMKKISMGRNPISQAVQKAATKSMTRSRDNAVRDEFMRDAWSSWGEDFGESVSDDTSEEFDRILKAAQNSEDGATTEDFDDDPFDNAMMNAADIGDPMRIGADDISEESAAFDDIYNHIFGSSMTESEDNVANDGNSTFESLMADIENLI